MMIKRLTKVGNSHAVLIDKSVLDLLGITAETALQITTENGALILRPLAEGERKRRVRDAAKKVLERHARTFEKLAK